MKSSIIKCAILGGIIVFVWGMISWMVLPWHVSTIKNFDNESRVANVIKDNASEPGIYMLPGMMSKKDGMSKQDMQKAEQHMRDRMANGPFVVANVQPQGMDPNAKGPYVVSLIIQIVAAFIVTWLLLQTKAMSYWRQVAFVTVVGLFAGIVAVLPAWNWWAYPLCAAVVDMADLVIGWFLAGLAIAKLAKSR